MTGPTFAPVDADTGNLLSFSDVDAAHLRGVITSRVDEVGGCWEWTGTLGRGGYGRMKYKGGAYRAHRVSYAVHVGPFDKAAFICHRCDNRRCVNPRHLFVGDHKINALDAAAKGRLSAPGPRGETHPMVTQPAERVLEAIARWRAGESQRSIARDLGVSQGSISHWVRGKTRQYVTKEKAA